MTTAVSRVDAKRGPVAVFATPDALIEAAAECVVAAASEAVSATGRFAVALSGGSTPRRLYSLLATGAWARRVDWRRAHVYWGDERCVPPDDSASNYRLARETLLDHVPVPPNQVHRIHGEADPHTAASSYEDQLRAVFATPSGTPRLAPGARFDLVLLGMGADGHTASLFPGSPVLHEPERWAVASEAPVDPRRRVTLTFPVINAGREIVFLISGADKAAVLARVLDGPLEPDVLPSQLVTPWDGCVRWLADVPAAAGLALG